MTQEFEDFSNIEKICRLPDELSIDGVTKGVDSAVADVTVYVPWNALVFYYEDYGYNDDLISIGHVESGMEQLAAMGDRFTVTMERIEENDKNESDMPVDITLTSEDTVITTTLDDSTLAKEFADLLPQTVSMSRIGGGREFYGGLQGELRYDEADAQTTFENGDLAYWFSGNGLCLLYNNQVDKPEIESGIIVFGKITSDLSVFYAFDDTTEFLIEIAE